MASRILASADTRVPLAPLPTSQVTAGSPQTGVLEFGGTPVPCGLWEHSAGVSTDVEVDEVFVVLSGRARIEVAGQEGVLDVGPGDVVHLEEGARTTWHVVEELRKFWVTR